MEAQSLLPVPCPNSATQRLQKPGKSNVVRLISSSSSSFIESQKWVTLKTHYASKLVSQKLGSRKRLVCRHGVEVVGDLAEIRKVSMKGVLTEKAGSFCLWWGPTSAPDQDTVRGSVHGDVVVLVTNKPGTAIVKTRVL